MRSVFLAVALLLGATPALGQPTPTAPRAGVIAGIDTNGLIAALVRAGFTAEAKTEAALHEFLLFATECANELKPENQLQVWDPVAAPLSRKAPW